jgi:hypothetical protein
METINLGAIKFNWTGAYNSSTSYAVDDVVSSGGNSYVCIQAHSTAQAVGDATAYWNIMSAKGTNGTNGTNGTDVGTTITAQGDILYRNASGLAKLGAGTSGQYLETKGTGANPVWSTVSTGAYSIAQVLRTAFTSETHAGSANTAYNIGTPLQVTPSASTDLLSIMIQIGFEGTQDRYNGMAIGVHTSDSWDTATNSSKLKQSFGEFMMGMGSGADGERYQVLQMMGTFSPADLGMSAGTNYYVSPHMLTHSTGGGIKTGYRATNYAGDPNRFEIIRYTA